MKAIVIILVLLFVMGYADWRLWPREMEVYKPIAPSLPGHWEPLHDFPPNFVGNRTWVIDWGTWSTSGSDVGIRIIGPESATIEGNVIVNWPHDGKFQP